MTANVMKSDQEEYSKAGTDDFIAKPVYLNDLKSILDQAVTLVVRQSDYNNPLARPPVQALTVEVNPRLTAIEAHTPPVSLADLRRQFGPETDDLLRKVNQIFESQTPEQLVQLRENLAAQQAETVRRLAHSLHGSSSSLRVGRMANLSARLEDLARHNQLGPVAWQLLEQLEHEFELYKSWFATYLETTH